MQAGAHEYFEGAARWLKAEKVHLGRGLSDSEIAAIEARYEFMFPADLRMFLQTALPLSAPESKRVWFFMGKNLPEALDASAEQRPLPRRHRPRAINWTFPNWRAKRKRDVESLDDLVSKPLDLLQARIARADQLGFWETLGDEKPDDLEQAKNDMVEYIRRAPKMIPVGSAFYMATKPTEPGNPVWEYFIEDLQYYAGFDLAGFLHNRFGVPLPSWAAAVPRWIDFWSGELHHSPGRTSREAYNLFVRFLLEDRDPISC